MKQSWKTKYDRLKEFVEMYHRWPDSQGTGSEELELYEWCTKQRKDYAKILALPEKMQLLQDIKFPWLGNLKKYYSPSEEIEIDWTIMYKRLIDFLHTHERLPYSRDNAKLCQWWKANLEMFEDGVLQSPKKELIQKILDYLDRLPQH